MKELEIIKYLLTEIEFEQRYNEEYAKAEKKASEQAEKENPNDKYASVKYWRYMPDSFKRSPRKSIIKANSIKIRQLLLKIQ